MVLVTSHQRTLVNVPEKLCNQPNALAQPFRLPHQAVPRTLVQAHRRIPPHPPQILPIQRLMKTLPTKSLKSGHGTARKTVPAKDLHPQTSYTFGKSHLIR